MQSFTSSLFMLHAKNYHNQPMFCGVIQKIKVAPLLLAHHVRRISPNSIVLVDEVDAYVWSSTPVVTVLSVLLTDGDPNVFLVLHVFTDSATLTLVRDHVCFMLVSRTFTTCTVCGEIIRENTFRIRNVTYIALYFTLYFTVG